MIPNPALLLRLHLDASASWRGKPLYRAVVETARAFPVAGASVFLVDLSYGDRRRIRDAKSEYTFVHIPVVVEIIDAPQRVRDLIAALGPMIADGLTTLEDVRVVDPAESKSKHQAAADEGGPLMPIEGKARRVTVYIGGSDVWRGRNLAAAIIDRCRSLGIAGATASLGVMGFGRHSVIHRASLLEISENAPEKVEIVDRPERIAELLPILAEMIDGGGLILTQDVEVVGHAPRSARP